MICLLVPKRNKLNEMGRQVIITPYGDDSEKKRPPSPDRFDTGVDIFGTNDYEPAVNGMQWNDVQTATPPIARPTQSRNISAYPHVNEINEMNDHINTIAKTVDMGLQNGSTYVK